MGWLAHWLGYCVSHVEESEVQVCDQACMGRRLYWPVRAYAWGTAEALASAHSDVPALRRLLIELSFDDLKARTEERYHAYRSARLQQRLPDGACRAVAFPPLPSPPRRPPLLQACTVVCRAYADLQLIELHVRLWAVCTCAGADSMDEDEDDSEEEEEEESEDEQGGEEDAPQEGVQRQAGDYKSDAQGASRTAVPQRSTYEQANPEPAVAPTPVTPARTAHARAPATPTRLPSCVPPAVGSLMHTLPLHVLLCRQSPVERSTMRIHRARLMVGCCYACQAGGVGDARSTLLRLSHCWGAVGCGLVLHFMAPSAIVAHVAVPAAPSVKPQVSLHGW